MDGEVIIGTKLDTKNFEKQISEIEYELQQIDYELSHAKELKLDQRSINEYTKRAEVLNNKLIDLRKKQEDLNKSDFFGKIGDSVDKVVRKVTKWGLAIFGVRSAYNAVKRAAGTLSQYNDGIKADLEYIQYSLATALEPIIRVVIDLAYKLLGVINAISMALFNYNLFGKASVGNFKAMNASANQLKKTLSSFDEMNVLSDNSSGGGGGSTALPTQDLSKNELQGKAFKSFWEKIIKFWEKDWEDAFKNIGGMWGTFFEGIGYLGKGFYDIFKGIIDVIIGIWKILVGLFTGDTKTLKEGWDKLVKGLKEIVVGLVEGIIGLALMLLGAIKGIFLELLSAMYTIFVKPLNDLLVGLWNGFVSGANWAIDKVFTFFKNLFSFMGTIVQKILSLFGTIGTKVGEVVGGALKSVINGVLKAIETILNAPIKAINRLVKTINKVPGINLGTLQTFKLPRLAKGGIINMPGRGVPIGGAIGGERGPEGVIPFTDSQQMARIGEAIGKYVTINATVINSMNGRIISRELQKVQNDNDFAFNR